ncbi:protein kinase domain-containing protein [Nocardiopsis algeriensis]|uniref:serine/threonine-protein kinase n=1 Tax=Nocardiopsis algeriensis TaxID=1478215 RepID=UPI003B430FE7
MAGERVLGGRYRLLSLLGRGGMGEVWRAVDDLLDRPVAVKLVRPEHDGSETAVARFRREARVTARLAGHPNIVILHDFGSEENGGHGTVYAVMELVSGRSLSQVLRSDGPLPAARAADLVSQAASGLGAAHEAGIVHRDVKPGNLMVLSGGTGAAEGTLKVLDFGIAAFTEATQSRRLTQTGRVMGTPLYMSPEQVRGEQVGRGSDLYSLGAILYQLLAGRPPFTSPEPLAVLRGHLQETPLPVARLRPEVPGGLSDLVSSLLRKDPRERPSSAEELRGLLAPFLLERPSRPHSSPAPGPAQTLPYTRPATTRPRTAEPHDRTSLLLRVEEARKAADEGRYTEAAGMLRPLLPLMRTAFGPDHPETLRVRRREAYLTGKGGEHARAAATLEELLTDLDRVHGPRHAETLTVRYYLATNAGRAGDHARAARVHGELLPDLAAVYGPDAERVLTTRLYLAFETGEAGRARQAAELLDPLVRDLARVMGEDHATTLRARHYQAAYLGHAGRPDEAVRRYRALLAHHERLHGPGSDRTARVRGHLRQWEQRLRGPQRP